MLRPAGMSDDDDDDDYDGFSFSNDDVKKVIPTWETKSVEEDKFIEKFSEEEDDWEVENLENKFIYGCTERKNQHVIKYLQKYGANRCLHTGWTPLLYAASAAYIDAIQILLTHGANPNNHIDGFSPLMALCSSTRGTTDNVLKCLELLIEAKANANSRNKQSRNWHIKSIGTTQKSVPYTETALMYACKIQDEKFVTEFIKHISDINICDSDGRSALFYAVISNKPLIVKILLEHKADTLVIDRYNLTAKDVADSKGFTEISALLANDEEEILNTYKVSQITTWKDLFPELYPNPKSKELLDQDISMILYGMNLESYSTFFQGMDLKTFLQLTEDDLCSLGIDISVHKEKFLENLEKFHSRNWHIKSIGTTQKSVPYTIYNGVVSLGNMKRQIGVIASSFQYIKNNLVKAANENIHLDSAQRMSYEKELRNTQDTLKLLRDEIIHMSTLAYKIDQENNIGVPASYITEPNEKRNLKKSNWVIILSITIMAGLCLSKTTYIQRLWNT